MAMRPWLHASIALICVLGLGACVSDAKRPLPLSEEELAADSGEDSTDNPGLALHLDDDWYDVVEQDITELEKKTERFTELASALYNILLESDEAAQPPAAAVDKALGDALAAYRDLARCAAALSTHLARYRDQGSLQVDGAMNEQFERVLSLVANYQAMPAAAARYDVHDARPIAAIFNAKLTAEQPNMAVPKPQRDALLLLDWMRQMGHDIAFVSSAVTDWVVSSRSQQPASHGLTMDALTH